MRQGIKAFLLSAFVFPGLGQLYNQDRRKGVALVLAANLLLGVILLVGMVLFSQEYLAVPPPPPELGTGQGPVQRYPHAPLVPDPLRFLPLWPCGALAWWTRCGAPGGNRRPRTVTHRQSAFSQELRICPGDAPERLGAALHSGV